ncbi:MAG: hypothetical protein Q9227_002029 [Pyrenula ochraceoflavens]
MSMEPQSADVPPPNKSVGGDESAQDQTASSHASQREQVDNQFNASPRRSRTMRLGMEPYKTSVSIFRGNNAATAQDPPSPRSSVPTPGPLSPETADRVFPVRSVVSVDTNATPMPQANPGASFPFSYGADAPSSRRRNTIQGQSGRSPSVSAHSDRSRTSASSAGAQRLQEDFSSYRKASGDSTNVRPVDASTMDQLVRDDASSMRSEGGVSVEGTRSARSQLDSRPGSKAESLQAGGLITARFKHVVSEGGHAIITGRDGETLQRCEDEPIHIPGAIQSFGLLIALREEGGKLVVRVVSENSSKIIGYTPEQLFKLDSFLDILTDEQADNLLDHLDFIRDEEAAAPEVNGPEVFMLSIRAPRKRTQKLWCAMHINASQPDLIICEFELEDDVANPLVPVSEAETPEPPEDTLGSNPTPEEYAESTVNMSKPLRVLRSARKKKGEAAAMEVFNIMSQVQEQLANAEDLDKFLRVLIGVVKELTGFHRVMVYQFDNLWNGRVVAELVDPRATKDLYKGLNFPASDIPQQARELYKINKVRLLYDRDQETARLVCRTMEDLERPLDLTHAYLRAMSPIHIKYLGNMAVRASMSISITAFNQLWGLISCHSYGTKGMRVSFPIRKMCRLVGDTASRNIERLSYASRLQARKLINTMPTEANPGGYIIASSEDLLKLFEADIGALSIRGETKILGKSEGHLQEILAMLEYLRIRKLKSVFATQDVSSDLPDLRYAPGLRYIAGLLFVPLTSGGADFIVFFRRGQKREVKWAGNPYEKFVKEGTEGYLEPRKSFKVWSESIMGKCREWSSDEIETAAVLCLVYGKFIEVWRQKEAALHNSQLTRLLLANSAHEVRTPLNAIINYLEIALEGQLDQETRENLARSHSASKSLIYVINDLLDLTKTEEGQDLVTEEIFDLPATLTLATEPFKRDAERKGVQYDVEHYSGLPQNVVGDQRRVRQVVSNLIANAIQHTSQGSVKVEVWLSQDQPSPDRHEIEIAVSDTGSGMTQAKIDALFKDLEQVSFDDSDDAFMNEPEQRTIDDRQRTLGLGLAVVARTVRNMNGQLRVKSEEGKGSRFVIVLGFDMPEKSSEGNLLEVRTPDERSTSPILPSTPSAPTAEGEVTLVRRVANKRPSMRDMTRRESAESVKSVQSGRSFSSWKSAKSQNSQKSDVDRLIDAIQEPHLASKSPPPSGSAKRDMSPAGRDSSPSRPSSAGGLKSSMPHRQMPKAITKPILTKVPGEELITDSGVPLKPVRMPEEDSAASISERSKRNARVSFDAPATVKDLSPQETERKSLDASSMSILIAEDDPLNSKIIKKRLEKAGHQVHLTVNGEECAHAHAKSPTKFDVILMDLQMPIVDGFSSTKMIRSYEKTHSETCLSTYAQFNGRIPIFAVSASLVEKERDKYVEVGFDGWILKPIDFQRVNKFLRGMVNKETRNECLYQQGEWEQGGWFYEQGDPEENFFAVPTEPSNEKVASEFEPPQAQTSSGGSAPANLSAPPSEVPPAET